MMALQQSDSVAVIGAGAMGAGIAQVAASAGHKVKLFDVDSATAKAGIERVAAGLQKLVKRGKWSQEKCDAVLANMQVAEQLTELADAALIVEAIVEKLEVKQHVFKQLEEICSASTIFATNTSSISVTSIASALENPERVVGMHFFNPAPVMKLVEVISGVATDPKVAELIYMTAANWGKKPVQAKSTPGFIVNRVARPYYAEGLRVLQEGGADVATIDTIMRDAGQFRMGPFELMDLIGHDVNYAVTQSVFNAYYQDPRFTPSLIQLELVNAGFLGRKTGRGFYHYADAQEQNPVVFADGAEQTISAIDVYGDSELLLPLIKLADARGIDVTHHEGDEFVIEIQGCRLMLSLGLTATEESAATGHEDIVLLDLALDYQQCTSLAIAPSDLCSEQALTNVVAFLQQLGKQVAVIDDVPGMILTRTVAMLANEAADTVNQQVCSAEEVDIAMQFGVNYPCGPLAWADKIGAAVVVEILDGLQQSYGEDRYRVSPLLKRKALTGQTFIEAHAG